jgi:hypothetical protein
MRAYALSALALSFALCCGCTTSRVIENTRVPEITVDRAGIITFNGEQLQPSQIAAAVRRAGFTDAQEINILIPDKPDRALMQTITAELVRGGYTRTIFLKNRKATSGLAKPR